MEGQNAEIRRKVDDWFDRQADEMLADLGKIIAVKSVQGPAVDGAPYGAGSREALALAQSMLEERGLKVEVFEDMIITADHGPLPAIMGVLAHLDVVEPGEGWSSDPYRMEIRDGRIYGRGAVDNKGPSVASMYALYCARDVLPEFKHGIRLILGSGEETGCDDVARYIAAVDPPPNVFTPDADFPLVNTEKGRAAVFFGASWDKETKLPRIISATGGRTVNVVPNRAEALIEGISLSDAEGFCREYSARTGAALTVAPDGVRLLIASEGKSSHAAEPERGVNAQTALLAMLADMPFADGEGFRRIRALRELFPHGDHYGKGVGVSMGDSISGELTLSFNVFRFTEYELAGNFDSRTPACADDADLAGMIRKALEDKGITVTGMAISGCHHTPGDSPFVQTLLRIYGEYTGEPGECLAIGGQTYVHEIPGGVAFGCEMPGENNNIHGADESIPVEQLLISAKMFARAIIEICG